MKISLAIAAILGMMTKSDVNAIVLWKIDVHHHKISAMQVEDEKEDKEDSGTDASADSQQSTEGSGNSDSGEDTDNRVQLKDEEPVEEVDRSGEFFEPSMNGGGLMSALDEKKYERTPPVWFAAPAPDAADDGDSFMRSMIMNYALEGKNKDGTPSGVFLIDEAIARQASTEILETHKGMKGKELTDYLDTYFPRTWLHFDVNHSGKIGVESMPQFMRFLASDQTMSMQNK